MEVNGERVDAMSPADFQAMMVRLSLSLPLSPIPYLLRFLIISLPSLPTSHLSLFLSLPFPSLPSYIPPLIPPTSFPPSPLTSTSLLPSLPTSSHSLYKHCLCKHTPLQNLSFAYTHTIKPCTETISIADVNSSLFVLHVVHRKMHCFCCQCVHNSLG